MQRGVCRIFTYCGNEGGIEGVLAESEQQTCLADTAVSDEQQFEKIIVRFCHLNTKPGRRRFSLSEKASQSQGSPVWKSSAVCAAKLATSRPVPRSVTSHCVARSFFTRKYTLNSVIKQEQLIPKNRVKLV